MGTRFFTTTENWLSTTSAFLGLLALAVTPIWIGSFVSLSVVKKKDKGVRFEPEKTRILSAQHALAFPIVGSIAVFYTYLALKSIDPEYINDGIVIIASILTTALFSNTLLMIAKNNMSSSWIEKIENYKFSFSKQGNEVFNIHITTIHLLVMVISIALSAVYTLTQHWIVGNIFAICIVINIMGLFAVDSFWTGFFLMCGMLFHDILWMSGSETISKISESFSNAPLNIVWPRHVETFVLDKLVKDNQMFTMFSTTDIVIPGIFVAYCLRFDKKKALTDEEFDKPFFNSAIIAYVIGAGVSIVAVHLTKTAQSALLYIIPALVSSTLLTAVSKDNLKEIIVFSPVVKSFENMNPFTDHDERPQRFPTNPEISRIRSKSKSRKSRSRSVSKVGRSKSKSRSRGHSKKLASPTASEDSLLEDHPIVSAVVSIEAQPSEETSKILDKTKTTTKENKIASGRKQRSSSRISRRKKLEDSS